MERVRNLADQARSYAGIEVEAMIVREILGFGPEDPLPSIELFEGLGRLRVPQHKIPVTYGVEDLPLGVDAESRFLLDRECIEVVLASDTYNQLEAEVHRARFCLAHEVGHVTLHSAELVRLSRIPGATAGLARGQASDVPAYLDVEWQANAFASALLMPAAALAKLDAIGKLCVEEVCNCFKVSKTCARYRLKLFAERHDLLLRHG